jgi:hypothetical protein
MRIRLGAAAVVALVTSGPWLPETRACTIEGQKVGFGSGSNIDGDILVRPLGGDPFRLRAVTAERVVVSLPSTPRARTRIDVYGVISFSGTTGPLPYQISNALETSQGMVKLYPGAMLSRAATDKNDVLAFVDLRGSEETLESVRVPCDALAFNVRFESSGDQRLVRGDGTWWTVKGNHHRILLRARPDERAPSIVIASRDPHGDRPFFERLAVRPGWVQIAREGFRAVVTGWVPTSALRQLANAPDDGGCCYGSTSGGGFTRRARRPKPYSYEGPAHVAIGTAIFAHQGTGAWAKVEKDAVFKIRYDEGDSWVEITGIPGVSGPEMRAYVPIAAIKQGAPD